MGDENGSAVVEGSLGDLHLRVVADDADTAEDVFERVWEKRMEEANELKEAIRTADRSAQ